MVKIEVRGNSREMMYANTGGVSFLTCIVCPSSEVLVGLRARLPPGPTSFLRTPGSLVLLHTLVLPASWDYFLCVCLTEDLLFCSCLRLSSFMPGNSILSVFQGKNPRVLPDILLSYPHRHPSIRPVGLYSPSHLRHLRPFVQLCPKIIP